jgi:multidrug resistance protein, MATE family
VNPSVRAELSALVNLALPMVIAQVGMMLLGVVDTIMVGHLSEVALAATALGATYSFATLVLGMGILHALDPVVAQAHGAGDVDAIALAMQRGGVMALALSVPYMLAWQASGPLLVALGQPPEMAELAARFIRAQAPGVPAFFLFLVLRQTLQGMGVVRPVLIAVIIGNIANYFGNLGLIYGRWGLPALGVEGSAWSTTLCRWVLVLALAALGAPVLRGVWRAPSRALLQLAPYGRLLTIGVPIGIQLGLEMWVFTAAALFIGAMGPLQMAGHQIAINLASLSFMVPLGLGAAAATRVGNAIGRADGDGARLAAQVALRLGASVMMVFAVLYGLLPVELAAIYSPDAPVVAAAAQLLPIAALFQVFDGTQAVGCGILRGAADTRIAAVINLVGYWVLGLPLGLLLAFKLGWGPKGLWWGLTFGLFVVASLLVLRVRARFRAAIARV